MWKPRGVTYTAAFLDTSGVDAVQVRGFVKHPLA
ncbi:hypothetical protein CPAR01_13242 [Colletotrichum paranaense]|uniref:Uncharacterized protein n=1 Tax=Colletotrichum paranaense TaxID=1914294 RepID=A0ABQ9S5H8_9PEZI|nr:uncharacterized protein CPAR01_13242 [Colletotrichum paranaense]KAK1526714.1 hypothetical protein CPAR01_13242 [Colletotrichum paranaense]